MNPQYVEQRGIVTDHLRSVGVFRRNRMLLLGASDEQAAFRILLFLPALILMPVGIGALFEKLAGGWTFVIVAFAVALDVWLLLKILRWAGVHGLTVARLRSET